MNAFEKKIHQSLVPHIEPGKAEFMAKYCQAYPGGYGEGDRFLGVRVPHLKSVARKFWKEAKESDIAALLGNPFHEIRLVGIFILVTRFQKAKDDKSRETIVNLYLSNLKGVNNWDLVDSSAYKILGVWLENRPKKILKELANSGNLWKERIAIIACFHLIRQNDFKDIIFFSKKFLNHKHDLIHKATGWMLREVANRDLDTTLDFIRKHRGSMPRTMLRYSIEKMDESLRKKILKGDSF